MARYRKKPVISETKPAVKLWNWNLSLNLRFEWTTSFPAENFRTKTRREPSDTCPTRLDHFHVRLGRLVLNASISR